MRSLVLGGCGFIGSHLVDALCSRNHDVVVFDRSPERFREPVPSVNYIFGDFSDHRALFNAMRDVDVIYHLISTTVPSTANLNPRADVIGNLVNTLALCDAMLDSDIKRIVYLSSGGTVYGKTEFKPTPEIHPLRPINSYGIVKATIEHYLDLYRTIHGLSTVIIRAANPYGPRQSHAGIQGVISTFLQRVIEDKPIEIWGDGSVVRDYIYVSDLAELCARAAEVEIIGPLNCGSGIGRSLRDVVSAVSNTIGTTIEPIYKPGRAVDVPYSVLDVTRAREALSWTATTEFSEGLRKSWNWLQRTSY